MNKKINNPDELLTKEVKLIRDKLLKRLMLTDKYLMSTSGKNYVSSCIKNNKKFILKIRRIDTKDNKTEFTREAVIYNMLEKSKHPILFFPQNVTTNKGQQKDYLLYDFIKGTESGTYFFLNRPARENLTAKMVIESLKFIQSKTKAVNKKVSLRKLDTIFYKKLIAVNRKVGKKYLKKDYLIGKKLINKNIGFFQKNKVFVHGDFNLKNIILPYQPKTTKIIPNRLSIIDWSDASLGNPSFDAVFFYISSWNNKTLQNNFKQQVIKDLAIDIKLFNLNVLLLVPKFFSMTVQFEAAITDEFKRGIFNAKVHKKLMKTAADSRAAQINIYQKSLLELK